MHLDFLKPVAQIGEGLLPSDVKGQKHNLCAAVEDTGNRAKRLLASGVPDLQLYNLTVKPDYERSEFHANGDLVLQLELVVHHSGKQATFANACRLSTSMGLPVSPIMISL